MQVKVGSSLIKGNIEAPASKSSMQRAVAASLLAEGRSILLNPSFSDDSLAAMEMAECLGATISRFSDRVEISGGLNASCNTLNCGESGLGIRLFSALSALLNKEIRLEGKGSILVRPMDMISSTLSSMGVDVESNEGRLPMIIKGPLKGGTARVDGSVSSQFLSGLLMALPCVVDDSVLVVDKLKSKPYIDLTISILKDFGVQIENHDYKKFKVQGRQTYRAREYRVESDWSGIAFMAVLGAIAGEVRIDKVSPDSVQADRMIIEVLKKAGAELEMSDDSLLVKKSDLKAFTFDISDCPDLAPPLVSLASFCKGVTVITGTTRLKEKESDRSLTLLEEFSKLGVKISAGTDSIIVDGGETIEGARVFAHGDHRIAMALAVVASRARETVIIDGAEAVNKSYPDFFSDMDKLNSRIEVIN